MTRGVYTGVNTGLAMAAGTSPSIAATPQRGPTGITILDHFTFAFQGANGDLWTDTGPACPPTRCHPVPPEGPADTGDRMAPGTSPSVTRAGDNPDAAGTADGNYVAAYQGTDGHVWVQHSGQAAIEWANTPDNFMAPGTSPSISTVFPVPNVATAYYPISFRGSNGDLWFTYQTGGLWIVPNEPGGGDTGSPVMAGTNPSVMVAPVDEPGLPLGGTSAYTGYVSSTGVVSLYGYNYYDNTTFELSTGQVAAGSPSIVSAVNWVDGGWSVGGTASAAHIRAGTRGSARGGGGSGPVTPTAEDH